ncbi:MAG TPA: hypothetical protein DCF68_00880 [Cyanothece sp. UBA12306]|nr:hypothetical protein [Cyanothece sp. UBA12306]
MNFLYLKDPLFLSCFILYFFNRYGLEKMLNIAFFSSYLNDLICVPFLVPIMLYVQHKIGLREDNTPPKFYEIIIPVIIWSVIFEVILPQNPIISHLAIADPYDVVCYIIGGLIAGIIWQWYYKI